MNKKQRLTGMSDKTSDIVLVAVTALIMLIIAYPLYYVLVASVSDPSRVNWLGSRKVLPAYTS